jgi:predicted metal-dependent hydrolase
VEDLLLPPRIVDYIVVHELIHLCEPHHTTEFWRGVERAMPDWEPRRRWLAEHGRGFMI